MLTDAFLHFLLQERIVSGSNLAQVFHCNAQSNELPRNEHQLLVEMNIPHVICYSQHDTDKI